MSIPDYLHLPNGISADLLCRALGSDFGLATPFDGIGDNDSTHGHALLSFISDAKYINKVNANPHITGIFCLPEVVSGLRDGVVPLVVDDPKYFFFTLIDYLAKNHHASFLTSYGDGCEIAPSAVISPTSVIIGRNVIIEPGAYIASGTIIGDDVIIRANATVGVDGFQHQRTSHGTVSPRHDGWLIVSRAVEIGYSSSISRGFSYRPTVLGEDIKIDALAYVAHGASIGAGSTVCTHVAVMGHVDIGEQCWLGPGAVISSRITIGAGAKISLGSVVTTNIPAGERYSGNFAIPHGLFMQELKARARSELS